MSVIIELQVPGEEFTLGRLLRSEEAPRIEFETTVPTSEEPVPVFWLESEATAAFEARVEAHNAVEQLIPIDEFPNRTLYALDWNAGENCLLASLTAQDAQLLAAARTDDVWDLEVRFPSHDALSAFESDAEANGIAFSVQRLYNPTSPDDNQSYGLTDVQREALELAIARGYYAIPREVTTIELGEELGISDQAVTERLRRAIVTLVSNTLMTTDE
ncbi:helix-turn-helix domain-containing protein [Salinirussus salinus]|uniref:helix-turn-helix domain-containing protein n=1 Tax=Salinirussus salinus TaxID=1198300 RepID=UPI00135827D8|nr:helix-turn-helix domain-containing protein [Salinirussus salinus]